jgi:signal transduction histidine kinase
MFGIPSDNYSGNVEDFRRHIHPEDRERIWQVVAAARKTREPYAAEFRVIRTDGAVRWVRARGRFYYGPSGEPQRMVGMSLDVTDRKSAEEALMNLSGRLLDAQEEERKRIAREIHDDYNQRLALLAIDLENLAADDHATADMKRQLEEFWARVSELGADLHALSHSLHSSTLESLGLVAGVKAFSNEFAGQQGIQVDFSHESVPLGIPGDLALCLFRVVQEGLRNVKRHSGAYRAEVHLEGTKDGIRLTISDKGKGFDPGTNSSHGIGIHSMEERLRILGGKFEISSRPTEGTRIDAWVPFTVSEPVSWAS